MIDPSLEDVARQFERWNLHHNGALILACLLVDGAELTSSELCVRLDISKSIVSGQTRILERLGILQRTRRRGERARCYRVDPGLLERGLQERIREPEDTLQALRRHGKSEELQQAREFYSFLIDGMRALEQEWAERQR